jgi:hypothetical protein
VGHFIYAKHTGGPRKGKWVVHTQEWSLDAARAMARKLRSLGVEARIKDGFTGEIVK